ncbi:MAG: hypothetical protein IIA40_09790 [SAR324 cluster bacterium]|nr:hypothetical protein [SAR324 cluster bacterium]
MESRLMAGLAIGAHTAYVYIRGEYFQSAKRLQRGGVNPVPIYVAGDIVPLKPSGDDQSSDRRRGP